MGEWAHDVAPTFQTGYHPRTTRATHPTLEQLALNLQTLSQTSTPGGFGGVTVQSLCVSHRYPERPICSSIHYGIRYPKTFLNWLLGVPNSIRVLQMDPLGKVSGYLRFSLFRTPITTVQRSPPKLLKSSKWGYKYP